MVLSHYYMTSKDKPGWFVSHVKFHPSPTINSKFMGWKQFFLQKLAVTLFIDPRSQLCMQRSLDMGETMQRLIQIV